MAWLSWKDHVNQSYWFIPSLMAAFAVALAFLSIQLEQRFNASFLSHIAWIYARDAQAARDLLAMVGGSLITVTGVIFSITLVALTNASAQYGSRILNSFARDNKNKVVLGAFVGTFLYCLLVMRTVTGGKNGFVPNLAVLVAILLAMFCFALLIYFIHHLIEILQFDNVVTVLTQDLKTTIDRMYPSRLGESQKEKTPTLPADYETSLSEVAANSAGYIESINNDGLMISARKLGLIIEIERRPGEFVVPGMRLAKVYPANKTNKELQETIANAFKIAKKRTYVQDVGFGFEQLQLVAVRALSPAVNNQILGMSCTDRIIEALVYLGNRDIPSNYRFDDDKQLRVIAEAISYGETVQLGFSMLSEAAETSAGVTEHILFSITAVMDQIRVEELRIALYHAAQRLARRTLETAPDDVARQQVERAFARLAEKHSPSKAA